MGPENVMEFEAITETHGSERNSFYFYFLLLQIFIGDYFDYENSREIQPSIKKPKKSSKSEKLFLMENLENLNSFPKKSSLNKKSGILNLVGNSKLKILLFVYSTRVKCGFQIFNFNKMDYYTHFQTTLKAETPELLNRCMDKLKKNDRFQESIIWKKNTDKISSETRIKMENIIMLKKTGHRTMGLISFDYYRNLDILRKNFREDRFTSKLVRSPYFFCCNQYINIKWFFPSEKPEIFPKPFLDCRRSILINKQEPVKKDSRAEMDKMNDVYPPFRNYIKKKSNFSLWEKMGEEKFNRFFLLWIISILPN